MPSGKPLRYRSGYHSEIRLTQPLALSDEVHAPVVQDAVRHAVIKSLINEIQKTNLTRGVRPPILMLLER